MALDARIVRTDVIELRGIYNRRRNRTLNVSAAGTVAAFAADVPFRNCLCLDVVVDRVAAVAEWTCRPPHVVGGVVGYPPIGVRLHEVGAPLPMRYVPLRRQRIVIVAHL